MKITTTRTMLFAIIGMVALGGCTKEGQGPEPAGRSNRIEFGESQTRAGLHKTSATALQLHIVSNYSQIGTLGDGSTRSTKVLCSTTLANAAADASFTDVPMTYSAVTTEGTNVRYWDDLHGRNSALSIYAIAIPGKAEAYLKSKLGTANSAWTTYNTAAEGTSHKVTWAVSAAPASNSVLEDEDLVFSNNVSGSSALTYVTGTGFQKASSTYGKELVFNHALSRITINVKCGSGFAADYSDFTVNSVALHGLYTKGTLNVADGTYDAHTATDIADIETKNTKTDNGASAAYRYTFAAQMFPGTTLDDVTVNTLTINISGNTYNITGDMIAEALKVSESSFSALQAGKNYNISLTIGKAKIDAIEARLVDWVDVAATFDAADISNARITLSLKTNEGGVSYTNGTAFSIYRASEASGGVDSYAGYAWATGYNADGAGNTLTYSDGKFSLTSDWYWPDNNTYYHFRTVYPAATTVVTDAAGDYFAMTGDNKVAANETDNYTWGAPFKKEISGADYTIAYSTDYGYCANATASAGQINPAIGPTKSTIAITQFYMMSPIAVVLGTSAGSDAVDLSDATVTLTDLHNAAKVNVGNGLVSTTDALQTSIAMGIVSRAAAASTFSYRAVPQTIANASTAGHIGLEIVASGNRYIVDLSKATTTVSGVKTSVSIWNPGVKYTYNITLTKKAVDSITATLVDWKDVNTDDQGIQIE